MTNTGTPESQSNQEATESFSELFSQYEKRRTRKVEGEDKKLDGTVIAISGDSVLIDVGYKMEGAVPLAVFERAGATVKPGDKVPVTITGRDQETGYYQLSLGKVGRPTDWPALEKAFAEKTTIVGTVTEVIKGGLSVDVGVRAFMPASRSGERDAAEMGKLVGQQIRCRITKVDAANEDLVVDRRVVVEEEDNARKERRSSEISEGQTVSGTVRNIMDFGAFVDIGGVDGLVHVSDISWSRVNKPSDVLTVGQRIDAKVLKIDPDKKRISLGIKQLLAQPWDLAAEKYKVGERIRGTVTRVTEFGAFVELEPGIEGLIHISEMSWSKRIRHASDVVKPGETVEAAILAVNAGERRISLGLKQALGDPWAEVLEKFPAGSSIEGPVTSIAKFGAFVQIAEGVEGMIHVSEISAEKRLEHPQEVLRVGQVVKAQVLEVDKEKRLIRLSIKQLIPSSLDEYIAEHKEGDMVTGRMTDVARGIARVELGEGVQGTCPLTTVRPAQEETQSDSKADLSSLSSMLNSRWKSGATSSAAQPTDFQAGQVRSFKITKLDQAAKKIELELA